jgi:hypothetical protein
MKTPSLVALLLIATLIGTVAVVPLCASATALTASAARMPCCPAGGHCAAALGDASCCRFEPAPVAPQAAAMITAAFPDLRLPAAVLPFVPAAATAGDRTSTDRVATTAPPGLATARPLFLLKATFLI